MTWKSLIPLYGEYSVRKKVNEIENEAASLPMIFAVLMGKSIENIVILDFSRAARFATTATVIALIFIYRHEAKKRAGGGNKPG